MSEKNTISSKLSKLIDVKSIVTLLLTGVFCYLAVVGTVSTEFLTIYTMIISFYFTSKLGNKDGGTNG